MTDPPAARRVAYGTVPSGSGRRSLPTMMENFRVQDGRIAELWGVSTLNRPGR
jgi:hypothetical protein